MPLPSEQTTDERRISFRRPYHGRIAVRTASGHAFMAKGIDVAIGGIALQCDENLASETRCQLHFSLPLAQGGSHSLTLNGIVVYTSLGSGGTGFKVAVRFDGHSAQARELLATYSTQRI